MTTTTKTVTTYQSYFAPEDGTIPYRFVGSYEYLNAIDMFDRLVSMSTPEQIEVYDKLIESRKEFAFYSGILTQLGANAMAAKQSNPMEFEQGFKKNSLAWLLALARVEIGATASMYGRSKTPFLDLAPGNRFGLEEYLSVLADDLNAHIHALATDQDLDDICKVNIKADSNTLAYLRRIKLVKDMLGAIQTAADGQYAYQAQRVRKELEKYEKKLVNKVLLATQNLSSTNFNVSSRGNVQSGSIALGNAQSCQQVAERITEQR